jgi:hypothetical protein
MTMDEKDVRLIHAARAAYRGWLQTLDVPTFTPPAAAAAPTPPGVGGLTLIARGGDKRELKRRLRPWLPGYLRRAGVEEGRADDFLAYVVDRLDELGDRRFRDALPEWLAHFVGHAVERERGEVTAAFTAAEAVDITLREREGDEPPWALEFRAHLRTLRLQQPEELLDAPAPESIRVEPALPAFLRSLYSGSLSRMHQGNETFELLSAA